MGTGYLLHILHCMSENHKVIFLIEFTVFCSYFIRFNFVRFDRSSDIKLMLTNSFKKRTFLSSAENVVAYILILGA